MAKSKMTSPTVATSTIISEVSSRFEQLPKKITKEVIATFLETIEDNVAGGKKVRIDKVGILTVKDRAARKGRNPQTGETIQIASAKIPSFKPGKALKDSVN